MTGEIKKEFTLRISQANSTQLVVILYDMLLCYLNDAEEAFNQKEYDAYKDAIRKSRNCVNELMQSLHMEYELAHALLQLYLFCIRRLAKCEACNEDGCIKDIRRVIVPLRDAYDKISCNNTNGAVMDNSQTVYAGLTYGRNQLTEDMTYNSPNRGMFV